MTKDFFIVFAAFFLGFAGVIGYQYLRAQRDRAVILPAPDAPLPQPTFALVPPSQAVSGLLTAVTGHAQKLSREDSEYKEASAGATILVGESIATKDLSAATASVSGIMTATMGESSTLVFANLFPNNFVLQQKSGNVDYRVFSPISVRALHALVTIAGGETGIHIIDTDMSVTVKSGSVKLALVDSDNNTHVWELSAGQRANIDDAARRVYLVGAR